jgi:type I restriction enzyme M protein
VERLGVELERARTEQSFCVPKSDIVAAGYDLSINQYREILHEAAVYRDPRDILKNLAAIEDDIRQGLIDLEAML